MKIKKRVLCPRRRRQVPPQFSWIDHRLVRDPSYLQECDSAALALYLILVTVGDAEGLSYYSDASLEGLLGMDRAQLAQARRRLCQAGLIAYEKPLYQVLSLEPPEPVPVAPSEGRESRSAREILRQIVGSTP